MTKTGLGVFLGAVVYFVAGALCWMVLPWMNHGMKKLPEEILIRDTLKVTVTESGVYNFPSCETSQGKMGEKEFKELFMSGPSGLLFYSTPGKDPMSPKKYAFGFLISLGTAGFVMAMLLLLKTQVQTFAGRGLLVLSIGVFTWFNVLLPYGNWMQFPSDFVLYGLLDNIFCFGLLGLVLPKFLPTSQGV